MLSLGVVIIAPRVAAAEFDQTHALFTSELTIYVKDARVDYAALKAHLQGLNRCLDPIAAVSKFEFKEWSESRRQGLSAVTQRSVRSFIGVID